MSTNVPTAYTRPRVLDVSPSEPILTQTWAPHAERLHHLYSRSGPRIPLIWQDEVTTTSTSFERVGGLSGVTGVWRPTRVLAGEIYRLTIYLFGANIEVRATATDVRDGLGSVLVSNAVTMSALGDWAEITIELTESQVAPLGVPIPLALDLEIRALVSSGVLLHAHAVASVITAGADVPGAVSTPQPITILDPSSLTSLALELDAREVMQADGSPVATWPATLGTDATSPGSSQPILRATGIGTAAALEFDGVDDYMDFVPNSSTGTYTLMCWVLIDPATVEGYVWDVETPRTIVVPANPFAPFNGLGSIFVSPNATALNQFFSDGVPHLVTFTADAVANVVEVYVDSSLAGQDTAYNNTSLALTGAAVLGARFAPFVDDKFSEMFFGGVWMFDEVLTPTQITQIRAWIATQWGV